MSQTATESKTLAGVVTIRGTSYKVYRLPAGMKSRALGIRGNYALEGPRGGQFFITDHGPSYELTSVSVTGHARPLRGLTRESLASFGVEV